MKTAKANTVQYSHKVGQAYVVRHLVNGAWHYHAPKSVKPAFKK